MDRLKELYDTVDYLEEEIEVRLQKTHLSKEESIRLRMLIKMHRETLRKIEDYQAENDTED